MWWNRKKQERERRARLARLEQEFALVEGGELSDDELEAVAGGQGKVTNPDPVRLYRDLRQKKCHEDGRVD